MVCSNGLELSVAAATTESPCEKHYNCLSGENPNVTLLHDDLRLVVTTRLWSSLS